MFYILTVGHILVFFEAFTEIICIRNADFFSGLVHFKTLFCKESSLADPVGCEVINKTGVGFFFEFPAEIGGVQIEAACSIGQIQTGIRIIFFNKMM